MPMPAATSRRPRLAAELAAYGRRWREEAAATAAFIELAGDAADPFVRERLAGHFTASAWLVSADGRRTLLVHHRKLGRWLQPGGHADGDPDLAAVALREAQEETGVAGLRLEPGIFDLDRHRIPEHGGVPAHWHYDVRYVVRAGADERCAVSAESLALAWRGIDDLARDGDADPSLRRMARKWLARAPAA
ncbi:NUDIX hydrolase [Luteimonas huabeiensis]|uniref:NUDIX hydrolase n=1 Tax=Luteimonas huabeiensis TaxID=1244513 RepID=UPI00191C5CEF|nr:NUDIX hydrolase [Luteimonas huabeiensis]